MPSLSYNTCGRNKIVSRKERSRAVALSGTGVSLDHRCVGSDARCKTNTYNYILPAFAILHLLGKVGQ